MGRKAVNKNFFKKWSPEMAYVLGFFLADGGMTKTKRDTYFIAFYSADKDILENIQLAMGSKHKLSKRSEGSGGVYRFQIGSKEMFEDLLRLECKTKKVKRLKLPKIPKNFIGDFVRGYFDGDGNVWVGYKNKYRDNPTMNLQVSFTSGSIDFLKDLKKLLSCSGISGGSVFKLSGGDYGRLNLSTLDALKLYEIMYNVPDKLYLKRKKLVFEKFMKMRL